MLSHYIAVVAYALWINLWIRGVKSVDKPVDNFVDKSSLWITRALSTFLPQEIAGYPQFHPQPCQGVFGVGKADREVIHTVHRPYYYYYSNRLMV
jgi:hypothetical protein